MEPAPTFVTGSRRRPTMRDVAERASVSLKTVSRVVNGEPGVSPALVTRVQHAVTDLDFRPNVGASSLRRAGGRTATVGLLLEDLSNPFSAALHRAVEDVAIPRGVMVFAASLDEDAERERTLTRAFSERRADGLILVPASQDQSYLAGELASGTAIVCVDREARGLPVDSVVSTNRIGAAAAVRHLAAAGHTRIAFLGERSTIAPAQRRYEGYLDTLASLGLTPDPAIVMHELADAAMADGAATALFTRADPPTAVFSAQNVVTHGVLRALRRLGAERSIALVGFDDFPLADLLDPGVTVVAQDPAAIGRAAAGALFRRLAGDTAPPSVHVVPTTLIRRGSGEIAPG